LCTNPELMHDLTEDYILSVSTPEQPLLAELNRQTFLKMMNPRMCSGHVQGRLLAFISRMLKPASILEIGTFTGYSTLCLAEGLANEGLVHTIEKDEEVLEFAISYFQRSELKEKIRSYAGDALHVIPSLPGPFDLVYLDGEKREYPSYYELCKGKLRPGGFILADNVLWNDKVLATAGKKDRSTQAVQDFNARVKADPEVENILLPLRDGIMLIRKKP